MALNRDIPVHSTKLFTRGPRRGGVIVFVAEVSDFYGRRLETTIWDDAADIGFYLESEWTGRKLLFTHRDTVRDEDGDVKFWQFGSDETPHLIHIFND